MRISELRARLRADNERLERYVREDRVRSILNSWLLFDEDGAVRFGTPSSLQMSAFLRRYEAGNEDFGVWLVREEGYTFTLELEYDNWKIVGTSRHDWRLYRDGEYAGYYDNLFDAMLFPAEHGTIGHDWRREGF